MALNKNKTDPELGQEIHDYLTELGVETPFAEANSLTDDTMIELISKNVQSTMTVLGLDLTNDSLQDTPTRVAKMYVEETFYGLQIENFPKITVVENEFNYDEMLLHA